MLGFWIRVIVLVAMTLYTAEVRQCGSFEVRSGNDNVIIINFKIRVHRGVLSRRRSESLLRAGHDVVISQV